MRVYQSMSKCPSRLKVPPRSNFGRTLPPIIVDSTTACTSCGETRPYQTPFPVGKYIITLPANLCPARGAVSLKLRIGCRYLPPICEFLSIRTRLENSPLGCLSLRSCSITASVRSSGSSSRAGCPCSAGSSICVWTSQPRDERLVVKATGILVSVIMCWIGIIYHLQARVRQYDIYYLVVCGNLDYTVITHQSVGRYTHIEELMQNKAVSTI